MKKFKETLRLNEQSENLIILDEKLTEEIAPGCNMVLTHPVFGDDHEVHRDIVHVAILSSN